MGGREVSQASAILNLINKNTEKEQVLDAYKTYPDTQPKGFDQFHSSTVDPMFCEIPEGSKVLDVGCNSGAFLEHLKNKKCDAIGVDVSETALEIARAKGLNVLNADAENLPFGDAEFDVVILREVLVHVHDRVKALKEIRRVLKPSGFLLGSSPHSNLENKVWDDSVIHHRYYTEETLLADLDQAFEKTYLKVLKGGQLSVGLASSNLAEEPAELLWKSGSLSTEAWEASFLNDTKTLRVWMGPTQPPGDVYYRMIGFAAKMRQMKDTEIGFENFNWSDNNSCSDWQRKIFLNEDGEPLSMLALDQLEKVLKVSDPWVFQITYHEDIVTLFDALKEAYPNKKLITENDDWIFDIPAYNVASNPYRPNSEKEKLADEQFKLSDAIIVSTSFLKENLERMYPNKPIYIIPNSIDFNIWDSVKSDGKMEAKPEGVVRIGYTGCANHGGDMEIIKPVIMSLLDEFQNLEFIIAQDLGTFKDVSHPRLKFTDRWVSIVDYPSMVKGWDLDIGIAPLRDHNFNRAKSNLRWLEYSALSLPTVASKVRPFSECINSGLNGILCSTKQEWYAQLKRLIQDKDERVRLGNMGRSSVFKDFNMDTIAQKYRSVLEEIKRASK
jgi:SAM-dependent methyltransferase/glycosyltransferase involved in cell wall biosynthesis